MRLFDRSAFPPSLTPLPAVAVILAAWTLGALAGCGGDREEEETEEAAPERDYAEISFPYEFTPEQKRAVGRFLEGREGWRLALDSDNTNPLLGRMKREDPGYQPYLAQADFTGDGREDFALAVTNDAGLFRVVWFRNAGSQYAPPQPVANASWLDEGGLFVKDGDLLVGAFFSDRVQRYAWNPEARRLERQEVAGELRS